MDPTQSFSYAPRSADLHDDRALSEPRERELLDTGDVTAPLEEFASDFARSQTESLRHMSRFASELHHLPPAVLSTPDEIDQALFDAVRTLGHPTTRELLGILPSPPPLRTVQRRLQGLVKRGLLEKTGARKDARYRFAEGF
jgi:Fic family protein